MNGLTEICSRRRRLDHAPPRLKSSVDADAGAFRRQARVSAGRRAVPRARRTGTQETSAVSRPRRAGKPPNRFVLRARRLNKPPGRFVSRARRLLQQPGRLVLRARRLLKPPGRFVSRLYDRENSQHRRPITPVCRIDVPCDAPFSGGLTVECAGRQVARFQSDSTGPPSRQRSLRASSR